MPRLGNEISKRLLRTIAATTEPLAIGTKSGRVVGNTLERCTGKSCPRKIGSNELCMAKIGALQICSGKVNTFEREVTQVCASKIGRWPEEIADLDRPTRWKAWLADHSTRSNTVQRCRAEVRPREPRPAEIRLGEGGPSGSNLSQICPPELSLDEVGTREIAVSQVDTSEIRSRERAELQRGSIHRGPSQIGIGKICPL